MAMVKQCVFVYQNWHFLIQQLGELNSSSKEAGQWFVLLNSRLSKLQHCNLYFQFAGLRFYDVDLKQLPKHACIFRFVESCRQV